MMNKYLTTFTIPVTVCLNPGQLDEAHKLLNEHYTGSPTVPYTRAKNSLSPEHIDASFACHRSVSGLVIRVGLLPDGTLEQIVE
jgi:hypothetical protein